MNLEVTVLFDSQVSHYFKRRKMFPTQEIKEERPDGSLVVTDNYLKVHIPAGLARNQRVRVHVEDASGAVRGRVVDVM